MGKSSEESLIAMRPWSAPLATMGKSDSVDVRPPNTPPRGHRFGNVAVARRHNMARIRSEDTAPERRLRQLFRDLGVPYRAHYQGLPGRPDFAVVGARIAVFVDGCFWHRCPHHFVPPATRKAYWSKKIEYNVARRKLVFSQIRARGWRPLRVWEHDLKGSPSNLPYALRKAIAPKRQRAVGGGRYRGEC